MLYQISLKLHELVNVHENNLSFEHITILDQILLFILIIIIIVLKLPEPSTGGFLIEPFTEKE